MIAREGFQKVASKKDLKEREILKVKPSDKPVVLVRVNGRTHAMVV